MKDSGIAWLGQVPEGWTLQKLSRIADGFSNGTTAVQLDYETDHPVTRIQTISGGELNIKKVGYISQQDANDRFLLDRHDILFSNINSLSMIGNVAMVDVDGLYHGMNLLRIKPKKIHSKFLLYLLRSKNYQQYFSSIAKPAINQASIPSAGIKATPVALPSAEVQQKIADFLDKETAKIDNLIAKQERLLELLEEKRRARLTHAVTRGLDPHVELKETNIPWLGEVPAHWKLQRAKYMFNKVQDKPLHTDEVVTAFRDGEVVLRRLRREDGFTFADKEIGYQHVQVGDLVIHAMDAFAGAVGVSKSEGKMSPVCSICRPVSDDIDTSYFAQLIRAMTSTNYLVAIAKGIRERSTDFRYGDFGNMMFPLPPVDEQEAIIRLIERENKKVSKLKQKIQTQIKLLKERRTSLISHAVTGKIKI